MLLPARTTRGQLDETLCVVLTFSLCPNKSHLAPRWYLGCPCSLPSFYRYCNRLATAALGITSLPLQLSCISLNPKYKEVYKDIINGSPPPSHDSPPHFVPPLRLPRLPLSELEARTAFIRMMARQQQPRRDTLQLHPPPPPINSGEIIVID